MYYVVKNKDPFSCFTSFPALLGYNVETSVLEAFYDRQPETTIHIELYGVFFAHLHWDNLLL